MPRLRAGIAVVLAFVVVSGVVSLAAGRRTPSGWMSWKTPITSDPWLQRSRGK